MLIAGYNTMPKEKKKKVDTDGLSRFLGIYAYISGGAFLLMALLEFLGISIPPTPVTIVFLIWTVIILVIAQRYDGNTTRGKEYNERNNKTR